MNANDTVLKRISLFVLLAAICLPMISCSSQKRFSVTYTDVFDTVSTLTVYSVNDDDFECVSDLIHSKLVEYHKLFDAYDCYDGIVNICLMNRHDYDSYAVADELAELISVSKLMYADSQENFNPAIGNLSFLWHEYREEGVAVPSDEELSAAAEHVDFSTVSVEKDTVSFSDPMIKLDFGAVAKGYAAQKCGEYLRSLGIENFALNLGGNVVTGGEKPDGKWKIGIQSPDGGLASTVLVSDVCVVTSGDYQRFYTVDGISYHHIIDPKTDFPARGFHSVTVIGKDSGVADALSTALFCMTFEEGKTLCEKYGCEAMWITESGDILRTDGFADYEK